ncbi:MAG: CooT family nickel-binding protein [Dehalococcoidia bacterium]|nr:CooT family nickel-binding protein [Dehalococcoidia bacterium]
MCLAKAYLIEGKEKQMVLEDVALLTVEGRKIRLKTLFGDQKEIAASVKAIDFQNASIILQSEPERMEK